MKTQSPDTSPEAERVQIALLRQASPARRFGLARSLTRSTIMLSRRAIARAHPQFSEEELALTFVELHYGRDLSERLRHALAERHNGTA
jgi:hypothetical protein